jgi:Fe-S cluster assembly iron-binding protein IscA
MLGALRRGAVQRHLCVLRTGARGFSSALGDLIVTKNCAKRILQVAETSGSGKRLRVGVDAGGCSGFQYVFELEDTEGDENPIAEDDRFVTLFHCAQNKSTDLLYS